MAHPDPDGLRDDALEVRAWEERTWEEQKGSVPIGAQRPAPVAGATASGVDASAR